MSCPLRCLGTELVRPCREPCRIVPHGNSSGNTFGFREAGPPATWQPTPVSKELTYLIVYYMLPLKLVC
jgi:hypothetical protein